MSAHGPQPTDHDPEPSCTLNRRDFGKAVGASLAIGAGLASSGTALGQVKSGVTSPVPQAAKLGYAVGTTSPVAAAGITAAVAFHKLKDSIDSDPSADKLILYQMADSEFKSLSDHEVTFENRITDGRSVAHLDARHGIATAWEEGDSASQAYDRALSLVRQYWELPEFNHVHVTNKSLLQLKYVAETARASGFDSYAIAGLADGSDGTTYQVRLSGETTEVDFTLYDGTSISEVDPDEHDDVLGDYDSAALETPIIEFYDDSNSEVVGTAPIINNSVVDSWGSGNPPEGEVRYAPDDSGGTTFDTNLKLTQNSVDSEPSTTVFEGAEFFRLLDLIHTNSDETVATYDQSLVEDLYAELDAGNITPQQVRGPEGMTRYLSGTDDPTHPQFRMALLANLGMAQPDFTRVAQMDVTWSGATGRWVDTDPNLSERHVHSNGFVSGESYSGALFTSEAPPSGFDTGSSYLVGPTLISPDSDGSLIALDAVTGEFRWKVGSGATNDTGISPDNKTAYYGDGSSLYAIDVSDGSERWSASIGNQPQRIVPTADAVYVASGSSLEAFDPADGSSLWSVSPGASLYDMAYSDDRSMLYVPDDNGDVHAVTTSGTVETTAATGFQYYANNVALVDGGPLVVLGSSADVVALNPDDLTQSEWSMTASGEGELGADSDRVYLAESSTLYAYDPADGSELWTYSMIDSDAGKVQTRPDEGAIFVPTNSGVEAIDPGPTASDVSQLWSHTAQFGTMANGVSVAQTDVDGVAGVSMMFNRSSDDSDGGDEITLRDGVVSIDSKTDAGGEEITHVTDSTIADIEALEATPDSIDTVVSDMDEFDSVDDIDYIRDVETILDYYGSSATVGNDDSDDVQTDDDDYDRPDYGTTSSAEFAEEINSLEQKIEQLKAEEDGGGGGDDGPLFGGLFSGGAGGGNLVGLAIIGTVVMLVVGFVTDLIPWVGN